MAQTHRLVLYDVHQFRLLRWWTRGLTQATGRGENDRQRRLEFVGEGIHNRCAQYLSLRVGCRFARDPEGTRPLKRGCYENRERKRDRFILNVSLEPDRTGDHAPCLEV